jgi:hypothetical protein
LAGLCKRFIDCGRALYLHHKGFTTVVEPFVSKEFTKENMILLAAPRAFSQ